MLPTLLPGDFLVAVAPRALRRGSLVVVELPGRPGYEMVKRLVGVPGDEVEGRTLGPAEFWVLGDDPGASTDSRSFGPVAHDAVHGVIRFRNWPPSRMGWFGPTRLG
jgi:type IV secretory pathway protease TraF